MVGLGKTINDKFAAEYMYCVVPTGNAFTRGVPGLIYVSGDGGTYAFQAAIASTTRHGRWGIATETIASTTGGTFQIGGEYLSTLVGLPATSGVMIAALSNTGSVIDSIAMGSAALQTGGLGISTDVGMIIW